MDASSVRHHSASLGRGVQATYFSRPFIEAPRSRVAIIPLESWYDASLAKKFPTVWPHRSLHKVAIIAPRDEPAENKRLSQPSRTRKAHHAER